MESRLCNSRGSLHAVSDTAKQEPAVRIMPDLSRQWVPRVLATILLVSPVSIVSRDAVAEAAENPVADVVARVSPAVVRVVTVRPPTPHTSSALAAAADTTDSRGTTALGSGFVIDPSGYIATNKHVVDGAISVFVMTADGVRYPAVVAGMSPKSDTALLRIDPGRHALPFVSLGDSDKMRPGDKVIAIGNPFGFDSSVSTGIVSAVNRDIMESPFDDYIQTDAAINHGNSGGPLFNMSGEVIGMNSVIYAPGQGSAGVGFALPSNNLQFVFDRLIKTGEVRAGMLPIHTQAVTWMLQQALGLPDRTGALVISLHDDGDKMMQGRIRPGDVVRDFNGKAVLDPRDLARKAAQTEIGSQATLRLCRGGEMIDETVTVGAWPEAKPIIVNDDGPRTLGLTLVSNYATDGRPVVTVDSVESNGTAADSGIAKGDIIVEVQQTPVTEADQALRVFWARSATQQRFAAVLLERGGKPRWIALAIPQ
jgi:serine protease Do